MSKKVYKTTKKYPCPFCEKRLPRNELVTHVANNHEELIPENYTAARVVYDSINKTDHGTCMVCKKPVYEWDERICRYKNLCGSKACREQVRKTALERHIRVYNKPTLLNDGEHQEKMLAGRKISGKYKYSDGTVFTYTGKYEKNTLEFIDTVLNIPSSDIQMPGPILEYEFNGETHKWITDIYYIPANLIIEVKDGGDNPNKRNMPEYRAKQAAKETMITSIGKFNYIRLTNNDFAQLLSALAVIKYDNLDQSTANNVHYFINESTDLFEEEVGGIPPRRAVDSSVWIEPVMIGNTFDLAIASDNSDKICVRDADGNLKFITDKIKSETSTVFIRRDSNNDFSKLKEGMNFDEALKSIIGHDIRIIDELCLFPEYSIIDRNYIKEEYDMITLGIKRKMENCIKYPIVKHSSIREHVILSNTFKGYYIHTPDNYLSSEYYESPNDISESKIDAMEYIYSQYLKRRKTEDEYIK